MSCMEIRFRRLVRYTVGGVALLAFALILRALFTVQTQGIPTGADSPLQTPSDPFQVTYLPVEGYITDQAWSPDGRFILFISILNNGNTRLLLKYDLLTNEVTQIASGGVWEPAWSPDATHVIYERSVPESGPDLYLTDSSGVDHVKVNDGPGITGAMWSPDSRLIVFST